MNKRLTMFLFFVVCLAAGFWAVQEPGVGPGWFWAGAVIAFIEVL